MTSTTPYLLIRRAPGDVGSKRLAHHGRIEAVGESGIVDLSPVVSEVVVRMKAGAVEIVELTILAFVFDDRSLSEVDE